MRSLASLRSIRARLILIPLLILPAMLAFAVTILLSDQFELAAFKGQGLTFRHWDQQLREPILLASPLMLVSVSPQEGFLHQRTPLDTLGYDEPDSQCKLNP